MMKVDKFDLRHLNPLFWFAILLIKFYRIFSTRLPSRCRFYPSCSQYALDSFMKYGFVKGLYRTIKRILKCHPFHPGGIDRA